MMNLIWIPALFTALYYLTTYNYSGLQITVKFFLKSSSGA